MVGTWTFYIANDEGVNISPAFKMLSADMTITDGKIGAGVFSLPPTFNTNLLQPDYIIKPLRKPDAGTRSLFRPYFIRKWRFETRGGIEVIRVWGRDPNELLRRRIVAAYKGSNASAKTLDFADDAMKEFVTQQFADGVAPAVDEGTRVLSDFSVAGATSDGPLVSIEGAWKWLLKKSGGGVIGSLKKSSRAVGTEVFFNVAVSNVNESTIAFQFRTQTGQPGQDVSDKVIFSQESGSLKDPFVEYDYTNSQNYIYALGQGEKSGRIVEQVADTARYNLSKWGRIEGVAEARGQDVDEDQVQAIGESQLEQSRPVIRGGGIPVDTAKAAFGVHWNWGDRVAFEYRGLEATTIIRTVSVSLDGKGKESIKTRLEFET